MNQDELLAQFQGRDLLTEAILLTKDMKERFIKSANSKSDKSDLKEIKLFFENRLAMAETTQSMLEGLKQFMHDLPEKLRLIYGDLAGSVVIASYQTVQDGFVVDNKIDDKIDVLKSLATSLVESLIINQKQSEEIRKAIELTIDTILSKNKLLKAQVDAQFEKLRFVIPEFKLMNDNLIKTSDQSWMGIKTQIMAEALLFEALRPIALKDIITIKNGNTKHIEWKYRSFKTILKSGPIYLGMKVDEILKSQGMPEAARYINLGSSLLQTFYIDSLLEKNEQKDINKFKLGQLSSVPIYALPRVACITALLYAYQTKMEEKLAYLKIKADNYGKENGKNQD